MAPEADEERVEGEAVEGKRPVVYCLIPPELAPKLHDLLRGHFRDEPGVEVVVEQRWRERRSGKDRREAEGEAPPAGERRLVRSPSGRRMGERRAPLATLAEPLELPRRARRYAADIVFVRRLEPSTEEREDRDTARLVARFQAGDQDAFSKLYARYFDRVYAYLRLALDDPHEAEDVTQDVFMAVLERLPGYERRRQPFRAWLFAVVRNQAISQLRKSGRVEATDPAELARLRDSEPEARSEIEEFVFTWITDSDLTLLMERLPIPQRQVLLLRYMLDLSTPEIARTLGRTEADVRTLNHRALRFLEQRLTALGRAPSSSPKGSPMRRSTRPANVLRARRFSL